MKLPIINKFKALFIFLIIFFNTAGIAQACVPELIGRVVTNTGAPVPGIWVTFRDYYNNIWYMQTDNNGNYYYPTWTYLGDTVRSDYINKNIDSNLDGNNDTKQAVLATPADLYDQFECGGGEIGHLFSAVPPVSLNGSFTSVSVKNFNCGKGTFVLDDIIFTPSGPPPTPIPTPAGLKTKIVNFGIVPISGISGNIYIDNNMNGTQDSGDSNYTAGTAITITGTTYAQTTTDSSGNFAFSGIPDGNYTVFVTIPPNFHSTSSTSEVRSLPPAGAVSFGIVSSYMIKGNVYNDTNKNFSLDTGESKITNAKIQSSGGFVVMNNGYYEVQDLIAGTYTISYTTPLPKGFNLIWPANGPPPSYTVTIGPGCAVDSTAGASCTGNEDITNLNFALSDSIPWIQTYGLDARFDNGIKNYVSSGTTCGGGAFSSGVIDSFQSPGLVFSGDSSTDFGNGSASSTNQVVGGITYPEVFNSKSHSLTSSINLLSGAKKAGIDIQQLESVSSCKNPGNKCNLQGLQKGFYHTTGDIVLNHSLNFPTGNYVIVADGNINITNGISITVSPGSTVIIASGKDLIIESSIHASSNICPVPAGQIQGIFSAGRDFIILGNNGDCRSTIDTMLNIEGALIINAGKLNGKFQNQRDLCGDNPKYPAITIKARPDFILNTPGFLTSQQTISQEDAP